MCKRRALFGVFVGIVVLLNSAALATIGLRWKCCPAIEVLPPAPNPCQGTNWSAAQPGTCNGEDLNPVGKMCRQDLKTVMTLHEYEWSKNPNTGACGSTVTQNKRDVEIGQCTDY